MVSTDGNNTIITAKKNLSKREFYSATSNPVATDFRICKRYSELLFMYIVCDNCLRLVIIFAG